MKEAETAIAIPKAQESSKKLKEYEDLIAKKQSGAELSEEEEKILGFGKSIKEVFDEFLFPPPHPLDGFFRRYLDLRQTFKRLNLFRIIWDIFMPILLSFIAFYLSLTYILK
jgi:hypothetical protein